MKSKEIFIKIKDRMTIGLIKFKNIVGEHKYFSLISFLFLTSAIIALVVFAEDDPYKEKISTTINTAENNLSIKNLNGSNISKDEVNSFDTAILNINYTLSIDSSDNPTSAIYRNVYIEASIDNRDIDAYWYQGPSNDDGNYNYDKENNRLTATVFDKGLGSNNQLLYLKINNIANSTEIPITVNIRDIGKDEFTTQKYTLKVKSEKVNLSAKLIPGKAYKHEGINGRYAPYGILLGVQGDSLTGKYFEPEAKVVMEATSNNIPAEISTSKDLFGLYDSSLNLLDAPNYIYNGTDFSVYNSGSVAEDALKKLTGNSNIVSSSAVNVDSIYLLGDKKVTLEVGEEYTERGISLSENGNAISSYTSTIYDSNNSVVSAIDSTKTGQYKIAYKYENADSSVTIYRNVEVIEKTGKNILISGEFSLNGNAIINILKGSKYTELGVLKNNVSYSLNDITYFNSDNTEVTSIDTSEIGEYYVTYSVTENDILKRTVRVIESIGSSSSPEISIDSEYKCSDSCTLEYYDSSNKKVDNISSAPDGNYVALYKIINDDYEIIAKMKLQISSSSQYELSIKGIKTDGIYYVKDNFIALGSYFVNVESKREEGNSDDIPVSLKVVKVNDTDINISETITNLNISEGTKTSSLTFYEYDSSNNLIEDAPANYVSYGEDIVLSSKFTYSKDADNSISEVIVRVPINDFSDNLLEPAFTMIDYYDNPKISTYPFDISEEYKDKVSVKYYYKDGSSDIKFNFQKIISYIEYTLKDVSPDSNIEFKVKLKVNAANHNKKVTLNGSNYKINGITTRVNEPSINITAFKARTKICVSDMEQEEIITDGTKSTVWQIYPSVSMPVSKIYTNVIGTKKLADLTVTVKLPSGINYVYNEDFDTPILKDNNKTLVYKINGKEINDWFDPISFETNYDIGLSNDNEYIIQVIIDAKTENNVSDVSSEELRTSKAKIYYQNPSDVRYSLSTSSSVISKNQPFNLSYSVYNNSHTATFGMVLVMPYKENNNLEEKGYTGTYEISDISSEAYCTVSETQLLINNSDSLLSSEGINGIEWKKCSDYANNNYASVTAIKIDNINIENNTVYEKTIKITPKGNKTDDKYEFNGYLYNKDLNKKISKKVSVGVISKKINGIVWEDFDEDGIMSTDEKRISGVILKLYDSQTDEEVENSQVLSNDKGEYTISDIQPGKYYIMAEYNTNKYGITKHRAGSDKSVSSAFDSYYDDLNLPDKISNSENNTNDDEESSDDLDNNGNFDEEIDNTPISSSLIKSDIIEITDNTKTVKNINLGLTIKKVYTVKLTKYVTKAVTTNKLGISSTKEYGNVSLAKLDVKDLANLSVKVVYTLELENTGYYPGYIYTVKDYIPDGMTFNETYEENKGWTLNSDGYVENNTLSDQLIYGGGKKYLTVAFDVSRKEAGSFVNYAAVDDDDLQMLILSRESEGEYNE